MRYRDTGIARMSEHDEQCSFVRWFRFAYPTKLLAAIPNGGMRNKIIAGKLKSEGVIAGMPDILIASQNGGYPALFIEMKHGKNTLTNSQKIIKEKLEFEGYLVKVCYSWQEAKAEVENYLGKA